LVRLLLEEGDLAISNCWLLGCMNERDFGLLELLRFDLRAGDLERDSLDGAVMPASASNEATNEAPSGTESDDE